ncbi:MAG: hypothetical protein BWY43_00777 [candidate division WS2 bacterium ADurb.Bin280]|uniref:Uncharacterized protein n=1 Tax=candidate division WS2 bacterium ADurb.Bin280 TaxID=1852829 RepID=A0A1V5SBH9_9BACT|nr:MAG: hypothetical protein BWY43_00777 [candidate division WS2 bacterium ADurb.Bin280]
MENNNQDVCCPKIDPKEWDEKDFNWNDKKFVKAKVFTIAFMPLNFGSVISKLMKKVEASGAKTPENLCLSDHTSPWNMDIYLAVDKEVENAQNVKINGKFFSKIYEGDFRETGNWMKDAQKFADKNKINVKKWYMWYTTCPKCAKKYGKNYVVVFGEIEK